jgi:hypothetical protein
MSKRITDTTGVNNSSKKRKSAGDKQLAAQLVQCHYHIEALGDAPNIARNTAAKLQAEDLSKRDINAIARTLTSLTVSSLSRIHVIHVYGRSHPCRLRK